MRSGVRTTLWWEHVLPLSEPGNDVGHGINTLRASLSKLERQDVVFYLRKPLWKDDHPIWLHEWNVFVRESRHCDVEENLGEWIKHTLVQLNTNLFGGCWHPICEGTAE